MRTLGAGMFATSIYRSFAEMCPRICARSVDVVVFGEIAHVGKALETEWFDILFDETIVS